MNVRLLSGVLLAGLFSVGSAQAATYTLGNLTPTPTGVFDRTVDSGDQLDDLFTFNLLASPLSTLLSTVTFAPVIGFSSFSATLYSGSLGTGPGQSLSLGGNQLSLTPGAYSIRVLGQPIGGAEALGGSYTLAVAAPVPEPVEWALMASGLGVLGLAFRRRRGEGRTGVVGA